MNLQLSLDPESDTRFCARFSQPLARNLIISLNLRTSQTSNSQSGKTPMLTADQARQLLDSIDVTGLAD